MIKKKSKHTVSIVVSCIHLPYVNKAAWRLFLQAVDTIKPDNLILNGDVFDFSGVRRNATKEQEVNFVHDELMPGMKYIEEMESVIPIKCKRYWIEGNHEHFWYYYHQESAATIAPTWQEAIDLDSKWNVLAYDGEEMPLMKLGDLTITHGTRVRAHSGWTARAELNDRWTPTLIGHTHRMGSYYFTPSETGVVYDAYEIGCLADQATARQYMKKKPNWQHGFAVVSHDEASGWFDVSLKKISRLAGTNTYRLGLHEGIFTALYRTPL